MLIVSSYKEKRIFSLNNDCQGAFERIQCFSIEEYGTK